jgi:hypothetical protein
LKIVVHHTLRSRDQALESAVCRSVRREGGRKCEVQ